MIRVRATFEKCGRAKYISHLDLNRCMLRTFRRSRLPIWYTEGFNPHPYYSFALALSLGFESSCEILNAVMPEGMRIVKVAEQKQKITAITEAEYSFSLVSDDIDGIYEDIGRMLALPEILIEKKTKKGLKMVDIKPDINIKSCEKGDSSVNVVMRLPAGTQTNLNPILFVESLKKFSNIRFEAEKIRRTGIFCADNEFFS